MRMGRFNWGPLVAAGPSPQPSPKGRGCQIGAAAAARTGRGLRKQQTYRKKPFPLSPAPLLEGGGTKLTEARRNSERRQSQLFMTQPRGCWGDAPESSI